MNIYEDTASVDHALKMEWRVVEPPEKIGEYPPEDMSIYTIDNKEVLGCSEWMRCEREVFDHIVSLHNASLLSWKRKIKGVKT